MLLAREKDGACDVTDDDANDARDDYEHRIKRRRGKRVASSAAALTDIIEKESNKAMAASSSSTVWMRTPSSLPNLQQMTTSKSGTGAMLRPTGTDPAAPDPGHVPVAQASQALQLAVSAAMYGSRSRGAVTIAQVITHADAEPNTQVERVDKINELLNEIEEPELLVKVFNMVQTRITTIWETLAAKTDPT